MDASGDMELPPDMELREPINDSSSPSAPALKIPYMGLWGLLAVSFSERAGITQPFTLAVAFGALSRMPSRKGESLWNASPSSVLMVPGSLLGARLPGSPSLE